MDKKHHLSAKMDSREVLNISTSYITLVNEKYNVKQAFMFGSWATGNQKTFSDIDIAVVLDDFDDYFDVQVDLMYLTRHIDSRIEPHPFKLKDFNHNDPLAYEVLQNGIEINISKQPIATTMVAEEQAIYNATK